MNVKNRPSEQGSASIAHCKRCNAQLPATATFCSNCGTRVEPVVEKAGNTSSAEQEAERYRITSLVCKRPYVQISRAFDTQQQQAVIISDLALNGVDSQVRGQIVGIVQREYEFLRGEAQIVPLTAIHFAAEHISLISEGGVREGPGGHLEPYQTLQELLQSGIGLPDERTAVEWVRLLSQVLVRLHRQQITVGGLSPETILVSAKDYSKQPLLVYAWIPARARGLFEPPAVVTADEGQTTKADAFTDNVETRTDIYSLGSILYLLLTGMSSAEATRQMQQPLRMPREINPRISEAITTILMQASVGDSANVVEEGLAQLLAEISSPQGKRANTGALAKAAHRLRDLKEEMNISFPGDDNKTEESNEVKSNAIEQEEPTISVVPLQAQMARRYLSRMKTSKLDAQDSVTTREAHVEEGQVNKRSAEAGGGGQERKGQSNKARHGEKKKSGRESVVQDTQLQEGKLESQKQKESQPAAQHTVAAVQEVVPVVQAQGSPIQMDSKEIAEQKTTALALSEYQIVPGTSTSKTEEASTDIQGTQADSKESPLTRFKERFSGSLPAMPKKLPGSGDADKETGDRAKDLLKRVQRFIVGEQQHTTAAAALIETPMRIQPQQSYSVRISVPGRNEAQRNAGSAGLSSLVSGDNVHIEVRSSLYQNYAYIVQQADLQIPAAGFMAEVTMPMQPLSSGPSGRRERLHIFFVDEKRNPLYEKPFVIEIFISHLVQAGREGHNVLALPV